LPNSQNDVGGWEDYPFTSRPAAWDSDSDGLPDWWEGLHGSNPSSAGGDFAEANADPDNDGFTRLCDYLAWMALPRIETTAGEPVELDLSTLTKGYTAAPARSVQLAPASAAAGSVQLLGDGKTVRFTPAAGFTGIVRFTHIVTDSAGDAMTGEIGVRVTPAASAYGGFIESFGLDPETNGAPGEDTESDGLANALEFLLGGNPVAGDAHGVSPAATLESGGGLAFSYDRKIVASGLFEDVVETSGQLGTWTEVVHGVNGVTIEVTALSPEVERVTIRLPPAPGQLFARLRVTAVD
jgi:hypothetical protein